MSTLRARSCICLLFACYTSQAVMQDEQMLKLRADARLVEVVVTVRDAQGHPVKGLQKSDFTILDNNKPRAFSIFSANDFDSPTPNTTQPSKPTAPPPPQRALPPNTFANTHVAAPPPDGHSTIILLDGVNGWFDSFVHGAQGIEDLMSKLPPDEKIALYVISKDLGLNLLEDYTTDRQRLKHTMSTFIPRGMHGAPPIMDQSADGHGMVEGPTGRGVPVRPRGPGGPPPPDASKPTPREVNQDLQRGSESVRLSLQALAEKLRSLPGRKSVFWITEGFPPRQLRDMNQFAWNKTVSALNDANIAVNTVDADGLGGPPRFWGPGAILSMQQIAEQTGGQAFFHTNDLAGAMATGIEETRISYTLAFYLSEVDGKFHDLKVKVDRPGVQLSYREGYWARSEAVADLEARKSDLSAVLLNPVDSVGVGLTATIDIVDKTLTAHVRIDPDSLSVTQILTGWKGKVDEVFIEFNAADREVGRVTVSKVFAVDAAQKPGFDTNGAMLSQAIPLAAGATKLSIAVRDTASGRTGSMTIPLDKVVPATEGR